MVPNSIHPGSTKMYHDHKEVIWWEGLKKDIAEFVAKVSKLTTSESRTSNVGCLGTINQGSYFDVGRHQYGFCSVFTSDTMAI